MQKYFASLPELRKKKNLTQEQLAEMLGVNRTTVTLWELGINITPTIKITKNCEKFLADVKCE
ncbi:MAG: helix-turn-helix transcriptional regulator [Selenomonadaceae bacterium]|nr:helix-turn-helix transcriptional regulator [Selenomonadaceae bacterium]